MGPVFVSSSSLGYMSLSPAPFCVPAVGLGHLLTSGSPIPVLQPRWMVEKFNWPSESSFNWTDYPLMFTPACNHNHILDVCVGRREGCVGVGVEGQGIRLM